MIKTRGMKLDLDTPGLGINNPKVKATTSLVVDEDGGRFRLVIEFPLDRLHCDMARAALKCFALE